MHVPSLLIRGCGFVVLLMAALWAVPVAAATCTSTSSGTWSQSGGTATWDCGTPGTTDDVIISHDIEITEDIQVNNLTIDSGATLTGYDIPGSAIGTLSVSGNWTNNGGNSAFIHNQMRVTLNGSSGIQEISGHTILHRLDFLNSAQKHFTNSNITIEAHLQNGGGAMERGTSTFTFKTNASIRGSNDKQFFNLIIDGTGVSHTGGNIKISENFTVNDGASLGFSRTGSTLREFRFDGTDLQTFALHGSGSAAFDHLIFDAGTIVVLPSVGNNQPVARTVTNNGILRQSGNTGTSAQFVFITDSDGPGPFAYQGLEIDPTGADFNATVGIGGNRTNCTNPGGYDHRNRCFGVKNNDTTATTANVTLYTTAAEDDIPDDRFYEYSGGTTWTDRGACPAGDGDACTANGIVIEPGDNYFLIGTNTPPTPVTLTGFTVTRAEDANHLAWETATEVNFAGFYVQRRAADGDFARIGDFVYAQGGPLSGASYTWADTDLDGGPYHYRLEAVDFDQSIEFFEPTSVEETRPNAGFSVYLPFSFK